MAVSPESKKFYIATWFILLLAFAGYLTFLVLKIVDEHKNPSLKNEFKKLNEIEVPVVMVCPTNGLVTATNYTLLDPTDPNQGAEGGCVVSVIDDTGLAEFSDCEFVITFDKACIIFNPNGKAKIPGNKVKKSYAEFTLHLDRAPTGDKDAVYYVGKDFDPDNPVLLQDEGDIFAFPFGHIGANRFRRTRYENLKGDVRYEYLMTSTSIKLQNDFNDPATDAADARTMILRFAAGSQQETRIQEYTPTDASVVIGLIGGVWGYIMAIIGLLFAPFVGKDNKRYVKLRLMSSELQKEGDLKKDGKVIKNLTKVLKGPSLTADTMEKGSVSSSSSSGFFDFPSGSDSNSSSSSSSSSS